MAIPGFNKHGCLPAGVHRCTLDEVRERFGSFVLTDRRVQLFKRLVEYVEEARRIELVRALVIDGSFTTARIEPNDIDMIVVLDRDLDFASVELLPADYNVLSRKRVARRYPFDIIVAADGSPVYKSYVEFFSRERGQTYRKGMLRVEL